MASPTTRRFEPWLCCALAVLSLMGLGLSGHLEPQVAAQVQGSGIALVGGALLDGTGALPVRDGVVLIRGDRIERVGTVATLPVPAGYESISTEGLTVLPGLWDLHVHLIYSGHPNPGAWFRHDTEFQSVTIPASARQMLMAGVTSVRDLAAPAAAVLDVKRQVAEGETSVAEVVLRCPWEADSMAISDLLMSQHRWGRTRCRRFLTSIPMSETKTIGTMTDRQRNELARMLSGDRVYAVAELSGWAR